jgi:WD40 repeat protein
MTMTRLFFWSLLTVALGGMMAGAFWQLGPRTVAREAAALPDEPDREPAPGRDRFHDPLPRGALARLGTVGFRHGLPYPDASLTYTPDGKHLISAGGGLIHRWDLATGQALVTLGAPWDLTGTGSAELVTADGKIGLLGTRVVLPSGESQRQWTEYDLATGKQRRTSHLDFPGRTKVGHPPPSFLSPDGKTLAEFDLTGQIILRDAAGAVLHRLKPAEAAYTALAFAPDGKGLVVGDAESTFRVFNLATGKEQRSFNNRNGNVAGTVITRMAISPNGKLLVSAGGKKGDDEIQVWPRLGNRNTEVLARSGGIGPRMWMVTPGCGQIGNEIVPVYAHHAWLRLWDLEKGTEVQTLNFPESRGAQSLVFTPDSRTVIAGVWTRKNGIRSAMVRSWDVGAGEPRALTSGYEAFPGVTGLLGGKEQGRALTNDATIGAIVAVSPDGKELAAMNEGGTIRFWDLASGQEKDRRRASPCSLHHICFRWDGKTVLTFGSDLVLREWDSATGRLLPGAGFCIPGDYQPIFSPGGRYLATIDEVTPLFGGKRTPAVRVHETATGKAVLEKQGIANPTFPRVISPDGKRLAVVPREADRIQIWDIATGLVIQDLKGVWYPLSFTTDGQSLLALGKTVSIWDVRTGKPKTSWDWEKTKGDEGPNNLAQDYPIGKSRLSVSLDGEIIAFARTSSRPQRNGSRSWICRVKLFDAATGKLLHQFDSEDDAFGAMAFSPDGKLLAAGGTELVRVWNIKTGKVLGRYEGHRSEVLALDFSPDGKRLASASADGTALIWDVSAPSK